VTLEATEQRLQLDVNDVGGLLARRQDGRMVPNLEVSNFISASAFQDITNFGKNMVSPGFDAPRRIRANPVILDLNNWRVMGWRFDPCATSVADLRGHGGKTSLTTLARAPSQTREEVLAGRSVLDATTCDVQLRLIAQPLGQRLPGIPEPFPLDTTMHLVFSMAGGGADGIRDAIVRDLIGLKQLALAQGLQTTGVPLGVHPALARDSSAYAEAFANFLRKHLKPEKLSAVAFMGLEEDNLPPWVFFAGRVTNGGKNWSNLQIPAYAGDSAGAAKGATIEMFRTGQSIKVLPEPPEGISSTAPHINRRGSGADDVAQANAVNNPEIVNFFTTDCISCHTATEVVAAGMVGGTPEKNRPNLYSIPKGLTALPGRRIDLDGEWRFRNLGYMFGQPTVAYRTVFETAQGLDLINRFLVPGLESNFSSGRNPGKDCSATEIYECSISFKTRDISECLNKCVEIPSADH